MGDATVYTYTLGRGSSDSQATITCDCMRACAYVLYARRKHLQRLQPAQIMLMFFTRTHTLYVISYHLRAYPIDGVFSPVQSGHGNFLRVLTEAHWADGSISLLVKKLGGGIIIPSRMTYIHLGWALVCWL